MVEVVTFGCRINHFESGVLKEKFKDCPKLCIVNTCAVTAEAERQCRQAIRRLRQEHPEARIVVTGCAAQVSPVIFAKMPEVDMILGNKEKAMAEEYIRKRHRGKAYVGDIFEFKGFDPYIITGFDGQKRAYVQVQQGCNHRCSYCIIPFARGNGRSLSKTRVIKQIRALIRQQFKHICLTGVDLCSYAPSFVELSAQILEKVKRLKVLQFGSLDPAAVGDDFVELVAQNPKIYPHFHLSVQSGDDLVLRQMRRRHKRQDVIDLCNKIRQVRPEATFGADFICGFPTETEEAFQNTCKLVEEAGIDKLHVFPYSERPGTPAALLPQVPMVERRRRAQILRQMREVEEETPQNIIEGEQQNG